jgi:hypothetical protein
MPTIAQLLKGGVTSLHTIATGLNAQGIPTPRGADKWRPAQVARVLAGPPHRRYLARQTPPRWCVRGPRANGMKCLHQIAAELSAQGIPTPRESDTWRRPQVPRRWRPPSSLDPPFEPRLILFFLHSDQNTLESKQRSDTLISFSDLCISREEFRGPS